jgi:hypothetical protein
MATTSYRLQGKDGPVEFDGQTLTIKRKHLREMFRGLLRSAFRSRVRITADQVSDVLLNDHPTVVRAPGAIHWSGKSPRPGNVDYPLTVRCRRSAAGDFAALRDARLAARSSEAH